MSKSMPNEIERFDLSPGYSTSSCHDVPPPVLHRVGLKYAYQDPASAWISFWAGEDGGDHPPGGGIIMLLDFIYHQFYLLNLARKKDLRLSLVPMPKDVVDFFHNVMYFFGLRKEKPYFGKFNYMQKFDYWAVYWGMSSSARRGSSLRSRADLGAFPGLVAFVGLGRAFRHAQRRGAPGHRVHPDLPLLQ